MTRKKKVSGAAEEKNEQWETEKEKRKLMQEIKFKKIKKKSITEKTLIENFKGKL